MVPAFRISRLLRSATDAFTQFEHVRWQGAVAPYDRLFGQLTNQAARRIVEKLKQENDLPKGRGLDCATGPAYVLENAMKYGFQGKDLVGVDFSAAMLKRAEERLQNSDITWLEADIQTSFICSRSEKFAWCSCNFGVLHLARPEDFFRVARQVLKPRGFFAFTVWSALDRSPAFQIALNSIKAHGSLEVGLPEGPPFFRYSDPEEARKDLVDAGFDPLQIHTEEVDMAWTLSDAEDLWHAFLEGTARTGGLLERQSPEAKRSIKQAMFEACSSLQPSGVSVPPYTLKQPCMLITARTPQA